MGNLWLQYNTTSTIELLNCSSIWSTTPPSCINVVVYDQLQDRGTWLDYEVEGYFIKPSPNNDSWYYDAYIPETKFFSNPRFTKARFT